jgi:hypothetical protein
LELERTRRQAAEDLAAERARTIQTLEGARRPCRLRALQPGGLTQQLLCSQVVSVRYPVDCHGPVDKPALRAIIEETRQRARAPRADKAGLRAARDAQAATAPAAPAAAPALPTSTDRLLNAWQGEVDGRLVTVYAGARAGDCAQGVVVVVALERGNAARFGQHALATPSRCGAVRVVAAHAPLVTLRATSGATSTLDVTALRFV